MSEQMFDQFIEGSLLGDAYISKINVFGFNHSDKQREYFNHKVDLLTSCGNKIRVSEESLPETFIKDHKVGPTVKLIARTTKLHKWVILRDKWYPNGKKIVPTDLVLTPTALAYWYMDDGSANMRSKHNSTVGGKKYEYICQPYINQIRLYTDGFDVASQELLEKRLKELGITSRHYKRPCGLRFLIVTQLESKERFKELVLPVMSQVPSMMYKIDRPLKSQFERLSEKAPLNSGDAIV